MTSEVYIMKILSIGNSFSQDGQAYLKPLCDAAGLNIKNCNLYIGGCSLVRHYNAIARDEDDYVFEMYGSPVYKGARVKEALLSDKWDVITLQEYSGFSFLYGQFELYLPEIVSFVREQCPEAKIALHQTWGYASENIHRLKNCGFSSQGEMFRRVEECYLKAAELVRADMIIPGGKALQLLADEGYAVHRDGQYASLGLGRLALAATWARTLFGDSFTDGGFRDTEEAVSEGEAKAAFRAAFAAVNAVGYKNTLLEKKE